MTKLEICAIEDSIPGQVNLYPEGSFYKAYQQSAWLLCTRVHPFKVSARPLKGLGGPLLSVGFPMTSLDKFSAGLAVAENPSCVGGGKVICFNELIHFDGYAEWVSGFAKSLGESVSRKADAPFNSLPVYGAAYRLAVEATQMASRLERNYRYSLGEDIRRGVGHTLVCIMLAGKNEEREANVHAARVSMLEVQLGLRLLNDLKVLPDKRYAVFLDMTEDIIRQLSNWERSERQRSGAAGVSASP